MKLLKKSMLLMMILTSFCLSTGASTQELESEIELDNLIIPEPEILKTGNKSVLVFTPRQYNIILQIYEVYQLYLDTKDHSNQIIQHQQNELKICSQRLELKNEMILVLNEDREFIYNTTDKTIKRINEQERKYKIRNILFTSGGVLTGIGIGILIGVFVK